MTKLDYIERSFLCILGSFPLGQGTEWGGYCFGLLKFQIFLGVLDVPDIFWG